MCYLQPDVQDEDEVMCETSTECDTQCSSASLKRKRTSTTHEAKELLKSVKTMVENRTEKDASDHFGANIAAQLRCMEPQVRSLAMTRIQQLLYDIQYQ